MLDRDLSDASIVLRRFVSTDCQQYHPILNFFKRLKATYILYTQKKQKTTIQRKYNTARPSEVIDFNTWGRELNVSTRYLHSEKTE